ncbi:MAG: sigma 54-interacting transcriptional regulator [Desulfovibrio sp.]|jgi:propionate catabolism operon transcriptional regulator|nr:sigma 54-interacting transcriptional regulator [Desulfovibrio sp.]
MPITKPYRFALLTHIPFDAQRHANFLGDGDYTLDYFRISYSDPLFGVQKLLDQGYEAVLFYSGFGPNILHAVGHSLALIPKTDMDIIKTLLQAREISKSVVLPVHANENIEVRFLERLLDMHIRAVHYDSMEMLLEKNKKAFTDGARVFVGGGVSAAMCAYDGVRFFPVRPNQHSVIQTIKQAKGLAEARRQERERKDQLMSVLKLFRQGVICVDGEGRIEFSNDKAHELLNVDRRRRPSGDLTQYYRQLMITEVLADGIPREDNIVTLREEQFVVTTLPISIRSGPQGVVAFISDADSIQTTMGRLRESRRQSGFIAKFEMDDFKGNNPVVRRVKYMARTYAGHSAPVLIHGETGTGKEVLAQAIHNSGSRKEYPFVAVNCAALPDSLLESELFGYEEGAFTGARKGGKPGVFEMAHNGTLFLDEIGDMAAGAQMRLLRALETREVVRVGGSRAIPVDIRVISATHRPLQSASVRESGFRRDLFYRLAVLRLYIPPLRFRFDDVPLLLEDTLTRYGKTPRMVTAAMLNAVRGHHWPGNVRELKSFIESYMILLGGKDVDEGLFLDLLRDWVYHIPETEKDGHTEAMTDIKAAARNARYRRVQDALRECGGSRRMAAARLGISYNTLWRILNDRDHAQENSS